MNKKVYYVLLIILIIIFISIIAFLLLNKEENITMTEPLVQETTAKFNPTRDDVRMVMIEGKLYYDTGSDSDITARCGVMDGQITSTVQSGEIPSENNQSNFGTEYGFQFVDENNVDVLINGHWVRFKVEE